MAPMLRAIPAQLTLEHPETPQQVTALRRLLAALCDLAALLLTSLFLIALAGVVLEATRGQLFESDSIRAQMLRATALAVPAFALLLVLPLAWRGRTLGEWAVLLRPVSAKGRAPVPALIIGRFLAGPAPLILLACAGILGSNAAWYVGAVVAIAQIAAVITAPTGEQGAKTRSGLVISDSRREREKPSKP